MTRYTPPKQPGTGGQQRTKRPRWVRISVWACIVGAVSLVLVDLFIAVIR